MTNYGHMDWDELYSALKMRDDEIKELKQTIRLLNQQNKDKRKD